MTRRSRALTPKEFERARRALMRRDPRLSALIKRVGPCLLAGSAYRVIRSRHSCAP